jgi:predicted DNA-binding protein YlxM (UPF0122 family)
MINVRDVIDEVSMPTPLATQALVAERRAQVLKLRVASVSVGQIAQQFGISESAVHADVRRALEQRTKMLDEALNEYRSMELEKLEAMERAAWGVLHRKHYLVSLQSGKVARHPDTDEPLLDDGPTLAAIDRLVKIQDRRAKLLGLDAAQKIQAEVTTTDAATVDAEIARLFAELVTGGQEQVAGHPEVRALEESSAA